MTATATVVVDLGFGDAGKGSIVDALARRRGAGLVVRFNGGCQAAHNVVDADRVSRDYTPVEHTFAQFGAGTFAGARTHLSRFMMVEPMSLLVEAEHLVECGITNPMHLLTIDPRALVTTPLHKVANQEKERRRAADGHGSCGRGIGETAEYMLQRPLDALRVGDLWQPEVVTRKLALLEAWYADQGLRFTLDYAPWEEARKQFCAEVARGYDAAILTHAHQTMDHVVFEGAQGVLIDEKWGFAPYYTWSNCTFENALTLLAEGGFTRDEISKMGVTRAYTVRHGPGPMPTESKPMTELLPDTWNYTNDWQGQFRVGHLDLVLLKYAIQACNGIDELAVTCLDRIQDIVWMTATMETRIVHRVRGSYPTWEMDPIVVTHKASQVCVAYKHPQWGLFDDPMYEWRLPLSRKTPAEVLAEMEPILEPWPSNFPYWISQQLGAPATVVSYGPAARDKRWLTIDGVNDAGVLSRRA